MGFFAKDSFIYWVEILTILAIINVVGYFLYNFKVFKKD